MHDIVVLLGIFIT